MECRNGKTRPLSPSLPRAVTVNGFQVILSSVTCLPSCPTGRRYLPYSSTPPPSICASSNQQVTRKTPVSLLVPGCKTGPRTPVQRQFSLELARCSNSASHSYKLYFPPILSDVWKLFSNPRLYHDSSEGPQQRSQE